MHSNKHRANEITKKTDMVRARITPQLKNDVEEILKRLGITTAQAIIMLFARINEEKGWPCELKIPNKTTRKALVESTSGMGLSRVKNTKELFEMLNKDDDVEGDE